MADDEGSDSPRTRKPLRRLLELGVLCSFAIAQPLLDVTGRSPETFVFYRVDGIEVVAFALLIVVVPPVVLWLVVTGIAALSPRAGQLAYIVLAGVLLALTVLQAAKRLSDLRGPPLVVIAAAVACGALWLVARSEAARSFVTFLTPAPLVFVLLFLLASPTGALVRPAEDSTTSGGASRDGPAPPVVMILLDELPLVSLLDSTGHVDERVFPNFARLADTSHWFRNATAVSGYTQSAVPSILSGRYPERTIAPSYVEYPDNLFSLLAPDYRIRPFETITQLCDPALCDEAEPRGDDRGFGGLFGQTWQVAKALAKPYDDTAPISDQFSEESAGSTGRSRSAVADAPPTRPNWRTLKDSQPERFRRFLAGLGATDQPTMHFLHLLLPHHPWRYLPSGATYQPKLLGGVEGGWGKHEWPMNVNRQAHLLQLAYTDRLLGDVFDRMERQGMWDDALVVVTADHGESFIPGTAGRRVTPRADVQAQVAWVPMFLKEPGQTRGSINDTNWQQIDLLPTMADALGVEVPFLVDGISQLSDRRGTPRKVFYNATGPRVEFSGAPGFAIVLDGITDTLVRGSEGREGLFVMGSRPDWIGRQVSSLTSLGVEVTDEASAMTARLSDDIDLDSVDPSSGLVPALVTGRLQNAAGRGPVVIAVNGTVAAVSEIYPQDGELSFAGIANDALFTPGSQDLTLFEVRGDLDPALAPIAIR